METSTASISPGPDDGFPSRWGALHPPLTDACLCRTEPADPQAVKPRAIEPDAELGLRARFVVGGHARVRHAILKRNFVLRFAPFSQSCRPFWGWFENEFAALLSPTTFGVASNLFPPRLCTGSAGGPDRWDRGAAIGDGVRHCVRS